MSSTNPLFREYQDEEVIEGEIIEGVQEEELSEENQSVD